VDSIGVIEPSESLAAPAFIVYQNGKPRMVVDYRKLNEVAISDEFPLPKQEDILQALSGSNGCLPLMLCWIYSDGNRKNGTRKVAFRTHRGLWQFVSNAFGYKNGPVFSSEYAKCSCTIPLDICLVYIDDIVIFSLTFEDQLNIWTRFPSDSEIRSNSRCDQMSFRIPVSVLLGLGGVGHCFAWHVRVSPVFGFNFKQKNHAHCSELAASIITTNHLFLCAKLGCDKLQYLTCFGLRKIVIL